MRRGGRGLSPSQQNAIKHGLTKAIDAKAPKSTIMKAIDRVVQGADDVTYMGSKLPKTPKKTPATVLHTQEYSPDYVKGKFNIGSSKSPVIQKVHDKKDLEMKILDKIESGRPKTLYPTVKFKGPQGLEKLKSEFGNKNFYIKPNAAADSGVGGVGFVNANDLKAIDFSTKGLAKMPKEKRKMVREFLKDPKNFTVQADMGIKKDISGANKEFRIHAFGQRVVPGASSPRGRNITGLLTGEQGRAEKHLQKVLSKLPEEYRNVPMAADVAKTDKGFKVVELNMGPASSGFLDPKHMKERGGLMGAMSSMKANHAVYKALTGRASKLEAGVKGTAAGVGATGALGLAKAKKEESV
jgi:hypothetical protein